MTIHDHTMKKTLAARRDEDGNILSAFVPKEDGLCAYCKEFRTTPIPKSSGNRDPKALMGYCKLFESPLRAENDRAYKCDRCLSAISGVEFVANTDILPPLPITNEDSSNGNNDSTAESSDEGNLNNIDEMK